ncbi:MAG: TatD family hydrolase, partial [Deltaproteobacteria bacterium]|nr:TatD family hydrolase [Deltaproteobacteria bacterium]
GIHPQVVPDLTPAETARLADLPAALTAARAIAVGECGLDGATADPAAQERLLLAQVAIARDLRLPLIIHVLRAHDRAPALLRAARAHEVGGVMHSYSGGAALVPIYRDLGFAFSFTGAVTWPGSRRPLEAARAVPDDLLLVETDAPDQTPVPHRPGRSEPAQLPAIIAALAAARGTTPETLAALTTANARRLFRL